MRNIQTIGQLHELQNETYVYAAIVAVVIFVVSWLIANAIAYKGGHDRSYIARRIWLIVVVAVGAIAFWLYNDLYVMGFIQKVPFQNQFSTTNMQCLGITIGGSLALSLIVMLCFRHSKFGSILGKEKNS
ncbi:MAG: hypothetical protein KHX42_04430 [Prevotella sp.]|nr:hypothetical protein [Prevotella sp.]